ncbi:unnamed protein product [Cyprideis torosa]|uniref:Btz domain-containing protein n=1 Tax=Cyprideis torosa TaxID=163714 RepID=A0A7R8ZRC6_9CRUS|nr:unnamed protein product [Cyprideis torosa]CAG0898580.1 unnamed protein product [Cyprideis torosa]
MFCLVVVSLCLCLVAGDLYDHFPNPKNIVKEETIGKLYSDVKVDLVNDKYYFHVLKKQHEWTQRSHLQRRLSEGLRKNHSQGIHCRSVDAEKEKSRRNPQYIPKAKWFYFHDDRFESENLLDDDVTSSSTLTSKVSDKKKKVDTEKWEHDLFDPNVRGLTDEEIINFMPML